MSRKIVIVGARVGPDGLMVGDIVFRLAVPAALQQPNPSAASLLKDATAAETTEVQAGTVLEMTVECRVPQDVPTAIVQQQLQDSYQQAQNSLNASAPTRTFVGAAWDGTTWTGLPA